MNSEDALEATKKNIAEFDYKKIEVLPAKGKKIR